MASLLNASYVYIFKFKPMMIIITLYLLDAVTVSHLSDRRSLSVLLNGCTP